MKSKRPTKMLTALSKDRLVIAREQDVVPYRNRVKEAAQRIGMGIVNQTKLITAASELVRNMLRYAGGGEAIIEVVSQGRQSGIRLTFADRGPGIADIEKAMQDGFSTGGSLGLGLPGARRLVNEFSIRSTVGQGTTVIILKWKNG